MDGRGKPGRSPGFFLLVFSFVSFVLPFYPLHTFIFCVLMSLIPLQHTSQTLTQLAGFEPAMPASDRRADRRLRSLGHRDRQRFVTSRYTDRAIPATHINSEMTGKH